MSEANNLNTVRVHLLDQLRALRTAPAGADLDAEIRRSKAVSDIAQTVIDTAKVEIDYLELTGQAQTPFLEIPPEAQVAHLGHTPSHTSKLLPAPGNGITAITQHTMKG